VPLGDARYLLSPGDLYALRQIPEIVGIGISALKIEGRYKDADYVALATRAYREAVDAAWAGRPAEVPHHTELQLEQVYSRGLGPFFLNGTDHQTVVRGRAPRHRGVLMGRVARVADSGVWIESAAADTLAPLKPGDGVVFDAASWRSPEEPEEGGRVFEAIRRQGLIELRFGNGVIDPVRIRRGDLVWRTHDPDTDRAARVYTEAAAPIRKQPVRLRAVAREGEPLVTEWSVGGTTVRAVSQEPLSTALRRPLDTEYLAAQLGRLGNTCYELEKIELEVEGSPFAPASLLNQLRREAVERLEALQGATPQRRLNRPEVALERVLPPATPALRRERPVLHLLVRTPEQLDAALDLRPATITLDYLDLYGLKPSLDRVRAAGLSPRVAGPRVLKPGEARIVDFLLSCGCPILVRSAGLLEALRAAEHPPLIGDFSLNAANVLTADELFGLGLTALTPTHDLNAAQVAALAQGAPGPLEAVVFQHLPVFHTEHCVFCRFLSTGSSYRDCGRPCESHRVALRDTAGRGHPVMADVGCRNTVFGAEAQHAAAHLSDWLEAGIRDFRLEFVHESADEVAAITRAFEDALSGRTSFRDLERQLARLAPSGITEGSLYVPEGYMELPVLQ
jgi:putative protease